MKVKIKREQGAELPYRATNGAAGYDLKAVSYLLDLCANAIVYDTGLTFELPEGTFLLVRPRSSIYRLEWAMLGSGVIDEDYRGTVKLMFRPTNPNIDIREEIPYNIGERLGQGVLISYQTQEYEEVDEMTTTTRGRGGHGSTGR